MTKGFTLLAVIAMLAAGCKAPALPVAPGPVEGTVSGQPEAGAVRLLKLTSADGKGISTGTALVNGRSFPLKDGAIAVSESIFQEGQRLGNLLILAGGYAPVRVTPAAALAGLTLSPLQSLASATLDAGGGKLAAKDNAIAVYIPEGLLDGSTPLALDAYSPAGQDAVAAAYQQDLAKLNKARGLAAPGGGACAAPLACLPLKAALGLAVNIAASASGAAGSGNMKVDLDLAALTNGWDGQGEPPASWPETQRQNAIAAATLLKTYQGLDAATRAGLKDAFGLSLTGNVLTLPVSTDPAALQAGFTRVAVAGAELLGVRMELTVSTLDVNAPYGFTPDGHALPPTTGPGALEGVDPSVLQLAPAVADPTGATAEVARKAITLPGAPTGSTLQGGVSLATEKLLPTPKAPPLGTSSIIPGEPAELPPGAIAGQGVTLISNNSSTVVSDNGGGIIADNGGALISNNAGQIIANNGSMMVGFPYLPVAPAFAKYDLLQVGPPPPAPWMKKTSGGVTEYLWGDLLMVRAVDVHGTPLTEWIQTEGDGGFRLPVGDTPKVFFIECSDFTGKYHAYSEVNAPGDKPELVPVDSASTFVAIGTVHLYNFIPPERARLSGIADNFEAAASATKAAANAVKDKKSQLFKDLAAKVAAYNAGVDLLEARIQELDTSWAAFNPSNFPKDRTASDRAVDQALAVNNAKALETEPIYQGLFDKSQAGAIQPKSLLPITLVSPF
jgi:hypothetical protein